MKKIYLLLLFPITLLHAQPGSLDSSFGKNGIAVTHNPVEYAIKSIKLQSDGKIIAAGSTGNIKLSGIIARYNTDGSFDKSFATNGKIITQIGEDSSGYFNDVALQENGKIVVTGSGYFGGKWNRLVALRYNKNGTPDSAFGINGLVNLHNKNGNFYGNAVKIQSDGKIVILGNFPDRNSNRNYMLVVRLLSNGELDSTFNGNGKNFISFGINTYPNSVAIQSDGKIVGTGSGDVRDSANHIYKGIAMFRLNTNGDVDNSFGNNGKISVKIKQTNEANDLKILKNGKIVVAGVGYDNNDYLSQDQLLLRFDSNGFIDSSFAENGVVVTDFGKADVAAAVDVQTDGKIVVGGSSFDNTTSIATLARYTPNGSPDKSFGTNGTVFTTFKSFKGSAKDLVIQTDGKILTSNSISGSNTFYGALARYIGDASAPLANHQHNSSILSSVKVYPNPVQNVLSIAHLPLTKTVLTITNTTGNIYKKIIVSSPDFNWRVNDLRAGEYYLSIENGEEKQSLLFLKQ